MGRDTTKPSTEDLRTLLHEQAAKVERLEDDLERQQVEKLTLTAKVAELSGEGTAGERRLSRAGLLKAAAMGVAASVGAGALLAENAGTALASAPYQGISTDLNTPGVWGVNEANGTGVTGESKTPGGAALDSGVGVWGASGTNDGVHGHSDSSYGVHGESDTGDGVFGKASASNKSGVYGQNVGNAGWGVFGRSYSAPTGGILGSGVGVQGESAYVGVWGDGVGAAGVGLVGSGGRAPLQLIPAGAEGAPASGAAFQGDLWVDSNGTLYICAVTGTPGLFFPLQPGNGGAPAYQTFWHAESYQQYTLSNSDGATWLTMDPSNLRFTVTPQFKCVAVLTGNSDLWTSTAGFNQDIAIAISGGGYSANTILAWKESGGFAGTFSPNAACVTAHALLLAGTSYTFSLQWKANKAGTSKIWAGAGPIGGNFSPTRLTAYLVISA